jgi:Snf7
MFVDWHYYNFANFLMVKIHSNDIVCLVSRGHSCHSRSRVSNEITLTLILSVEQTSFAIDSVKDTQTTVQAMQAASKQLKVEHKKINISEIEDMHDDLAGVYLSVAFCTLILSLCFTNDTF